MSGRHCTHSRSAIEDSLYHRGGYSTAESREIFCDNCRLQRWLDVEVALAASQAKLGMIPQKAAEKICDAAQMELLDASVIVRGIQETQHSLVPLLRALEQVSGAYAAQYVHFGATTQDIQDTGQSLEMRDVLDLVTRDLNSILEILEPMALHHKDQLMVGRTHAQPAMPISFGLKVASWIDELTRHWQRVEEIRPRILVAELFGGVGTMAAFKGQGPALLQEFAARLNLGVPTVAWHVARDRVSEFIYVLAAIAATLARIADEVRTLSRQPYMELEEPWDSGNLGSSTMPHKRNPERSEQIVVLARLARAQVGLGLEAMIVEHERDYRGTRLEWPAVATVSHSTLAALSLIKTILAGLVVHSETMARTAEGRADVQCSEALIFSLGMRIGKGTAFNLVWELCQEAVKQHRSLRDLALENSEINSVMARDRIEQIFDPASYLGSSAYLVETAVETSRKQRT